MSCRNLVSAVPLVSENKPTVRASIIGGLLYMLVKSALLQILKYVQEIVGTPAGRVISCSLLSLPFIPNYHTSDYQPTTQLTTTNIPIISPTIPTIPKQYTSGPPDYSPASKADDTPDTPPSPTHGKPFIEITASTQRSPVIPRRRVMILAPRQPIPHGRPYRYHLNGPVHMMTTRKRVRPLPVQQLAMGHLVDHSSPDDSARDSSLGSSSEASSDFHLDASSDSSSRHSLSDHPSPDLPSTSAGPSRKRRRSFMTSVPALSSVFGALSLVCANSIPSPKRVRDSGYLADVEVDLREASLRDDVIVRDALRDRGIDARVVVEAVDREESETGTRGLVEVRVERVTHHEMPEDTPEPAQEERAIEVTYETLGDLVQRIVRVESAVTALTKRIAELERDNRRLKGTMSVESQRVDRLQRDMLHLQRELRQMQRL
ncbi:hypothetical protein Tco_0217320 [Tanacetum coccineum]